MDDGKKNKQGVLKAEMIYQKTRTQNLADVRTLNMWGYELEDVSIASNLINAETLSFPINKIRTLAPFQTCRNLQNLLLRQNQISDINEIQYLADLPYLKNLTLAENPVASMPGYRETVINALPQLEKLDDLEISMSPPPPKIQQNIQQQPRRQKNVKQSYNQNNYYSDNDDNDIYSFENINNNNFNRRRKVKEVSNNYNDVAPVKKQFNILDKIDCNQSQIPKNPPRISYNQSLNKNDSNTNFSQSHHSPTSSLDEHLLTAVLSIIPELSVESLQIVLEAIRDRCK